MSLTEFDLIKQYFSQRQSKRSDVILGIGDDAAIVDVPSDKQLVVATDSLVAGIHFSEQTSPKDVAYKSLAVNLSDFAAMGAEPAWLTLALTMPEANAQWLQAFSEGLFELIDHYSLQLIGGDTTRGPLTISIQLLGFIPYGKALRRQCAQINDGIYVTGQLGDAGLALLDKQQPLQLTALSRNHINDRLNRPTPRCDIGQQLLDVATSAIDVSDGVLADLSHILESSAVAATINVDSIPRSPILLESVSNAQGLQLALTAGDDYELCFTAPDEMQDKIFAMASQQAVCCTLIGRIKQGAGLELKHSDGTIYHSPLLGYKHF